MDRKWWLVFVWSLAIFSALPAKSSEVCGTRLENQLFSGISGEAFQFRMGAIRNEFGKLENKAIVVSGGNCLAVCDVLGLDAASGNFQKSWKLNCRTPSGGLFSSPGSFTQNDSRGGQSVLRLGTWLNGFRETVLRPLDVKLARR